MQIVRIDRQDVFFKQINFIFASWRTSAYLVFVKRFSKEHIVVDFTDALSHIVYYGHLFKIVD